MYKEASRLKLRFATNVGPLSAEQLWDLTLNQLSAAIKQVKRVLTKDNDDELSFLGETKIDVENQLRFDILKDVYLTKKKESEDRLSMIEIKAHNAKIDAIIAEKKDADLRNMSLEELEKLRK